MSKKSNPPDEEFVLTKAALWSMADERILDAKALLAGNRWAFAYYNAGYAVEYALKACVLSRMTYTGLVFTRSPPDCKVHDLQVLIGHAGLRTDLEAKLKQGGKFPIFWGRAILWKETSRYKPEGQTAAEELVEAIDGDPEGVLPWLRTC